MTRQFTAIDLLRIKDLLQIAYFGHKFAIPSIICRSFEKE